MTILAKQIMGQMLQRQPNDEEYRRLRTLLDLLPEAMRSSPASMADIAMKVAFQSQVEMTLNRASWAVQQQMHKDLPARVEAAAVSALNKVRDGIPIDAKDASNRLLRLSIYWMTLFCLTVGTASFVLGLAFNEWRHISQQVALRVDRSRCVDAAIGRLAVLDRKGADRGTEQLDKHRNNLLECVAEP